MLALSMPHALPTASAASRMPCRTSAGRFGAGCEFDNLLVPPLDRAIALEEVDQTAVRVADELHLDVLGPLDELFEEDIGDAERRPGLAAGGFDRLLELVGGVNDAHAAAAAAHRRLHDDRVAEFRRQ